MRGIYRALFASAAIAMSANVAHAETTYSVASGVDFSSGDYGSDADTEVISLPLVFRVIMGVKGTWRGFTANTEEMTPAGEEVKP